MSTKGEHLGHHVRVRREELDRNQLEIHAAGGPSNSTLTEIENGRLENLTRATARKLDRGLQWEPGSARRVWNGGDPEPLLSGVSPQNSREIREAVERARLSATQRAAILAILGDESETG